MTMPTDGQPAYAPGWYADVNAPGTERWYDGTGWTAHVRAAEAQTAPATAATAAYTTPIAEPAAYATPIAEPAYPAYSAPVADAADPSTKRPWYKRKGIVIPVGIVAALIVVGGIGGALGGGRDDDSVAAGDRTDTAEVVVDEVVEPVLVDVPSVVGMSGSDAQAALSALGFKVDVGGGDVTMPVTTQDVAAGAQAEEGSTVVLVLQEKPKLTLAQENAVDSAESYLRFTGFSRTGLIGQLEYEGFTTEEATFAVDFVAPDWNAEAAEKAKSYMELTSFSRQQLLDQLLFEGFSPAEAEFGAVSVGY